MEFNSATSMVSDFWSPLCQVWEQRIDACKRARSRFDRIHKQCASYFNSTAGFMWSSEHKSEFFDGALPDPKFKITLNKAFEFVSIYGPSLFWQYPARKVMSQRTLQLVPEMFGDPSDPQVQQIFQMFMMEDQNEQSRKKFINQMMEIYLNYSQREQPGGLMFNAIMAITDALISGRGVMWPETYYFPGAEHPYTRLQFGSVTNFYIDPDCHDPNLDTAGYIMRRHVNPIWQVERMFDLPAGSLEGKGKISSADQTIRNDMNMNSDKAKTFNCIEWYEIWSRVGLGPRVNSIAHPWLGAFDETVGDYAYLCVAPGVNFPLNSHPDNYFGMNPWTDDDVHEAFEWRAPNYGHVYPVWKDNRWPVAFLDFNPVPNSPWPVAPLSPGIGELIALNVLTSSYVDMAWENRKTILGYLESSSEEVRSALESDDAFIKIPMNDIMNKSIDDMMQIMKRPEANKDILQAIAMMRNSFDEAVGLNELMYGNAGATQIRVAADIRERSSRSSIRPDKMAQDVARWMTNASQLEMFMAALHVKGNSLTHLLGRIGAQLWDQEFSSQNVDALMREMRATVEASEVRRPDKERDTANIQALQQYVLPTLQQFAQETTNTEPYNGFLQQMATAMEMDTAPFQLPPWTPPQDPQAQQMAQQAQQLEMQKMAAEVEDKQAGAVQKQAAAQKAMVDAAATAAESGVTDGQVSEMKHEQEIRHREDLHTQEVIHNQETHVQKLLFDETDALLDQAITASDAELKNNLKDGDSEGS